MEELSFSFASSRFPPHQADTIAWAAARALVEWRKGTTLRVVRVIFDDSIQAGARISRILRSRRDQEYKVADIVSVFHDFGGVEIPIMPSLGESLSVGVWTTLPSKVTVKTDTCEVSRLFYHIFSSWKNCKGGTASCRKVADIPNYGSIEIPKESLALSKESLDFLSNQSGCYF